MDFSPDAVTWLGCEREDLWVFDKLIVAKMAGHVCGPRGVPVPKAGDYIVRPTINIEGMGEKARIMHLEHCTRELHPGEFWCEIFEGEHLSVDYRRYQPILSVVGTHHPVNFGRFSKWEVVEHSLPLPQFIGYLPLRYAILNCEFIGGKLIEIHLRGNPDFAHGNTSVIPWWDDEPDPQPSDYRYIDDAGTELQGGHRRGIWVR